MKPIFTCLSHVPRRQHRRHNQKDLPTYGGYRPTKFDACPSIGLACSHFRLVFARACAMARGTCHVALIAPKSAPLRLRRSGASNGATSVRLDFEPFLTLFLCQILKPKNKIRYSSFVEVVKRRLFGVFAISSKTQFFTNCQTQTRHKNQ